MLIERATCASCGSALHGGLIAHGLCVSCLLAAPALTPGEAHALPSGARLGPYEIVSAIGNGGMGDVYRARDTRLHRDVAVKVLPAALAATPRLAESLEREARIVARLNHPHVCAVHDIGREHELTYLVMELVDGETLADRLARGPLPIAEALDRAVEIADGLDHAHRQSITHRDLKPANIMLTHAGAKLLDFGLAVLRDVDDGSLDQTRGSARSGLAGTLPYMAPEQLDGQPADTRSDVFAFGLVLYEMLTARTAFAGSSRARQVVAVLSAEPPLPSTIRPEIPAALDRLVDRCVRKDPDERWQSMRDVRFELQSLRDHPPRRRRRRPVAWRSAALWATVGLVLVAAALSVVAPSAHAPSYPSGPGVFRFTVTPPPIREAPAPGGLAFVSPDGSMLAWVLSAGDGRTTLATQRFDSNQTTHIARTDGVRWPFWSPDSRTIAFFDHGELKRVSVAGGATETIAPAPRGQGGAWSADGTILFAPDRNGPLYRVAAHGGPPTPVTTLDRTRGESSHEWPVFLPDGRHFVYFASSDRPESRGLYLGELGSNSRVWLGAADGAAVYAPPGYLLFTRASMLIAQRLDAAKNHLTGEPLMIAPRTYASNTLMPPSFSVSTTGVLVYHVARLYQHQLAWFNRSGRELSRPLEPGSYFGPALSADDQHLAVYRHDPDTWQLGVWLSDLPRNTFSRLTTDPSPSAHALWSPDGRTLVFATNDEQTHAIHAIDVPGGRARRVFAATKSVIPTDWSPDGRSLLLQLQQEGNRMETWVLPLADDAKPTVYLRSRFNEGQARWSPSGRWIAYSSDESGRLEVYVRSFAAPEIKWQISTNGGSQPVWRRDGRELFYLAPDRRLMSVALDAGPALQPGIAAELFQVPRDIPSDPRISYAVTADGQRFLFNVVAADRAMPPSLQTNVVLNWQSAVHSQGEP